MGQLELFLLAAPVLLFSMVAHEYAHGYAALRQGDQTALLLGRLTWNPLKHIDPFLTVLLPILTWFGGGALFGGAKPVPVNPRNYRHYRRGDIIVSLAGIAANFGLVVASTLGIVVLGLLGRAAPPAVAGAFGTLQVMLRISIEFNLLLIFFNLLPLPPLDGSHVFKYLLPPAWALRYQRVGMYGILLLMLFFTFGRRIPVLGAAFGAWMAPVGILERLALGLVYQFLLPSPLQVA